MITERTRTTRARGLAPAPRRREVGTGFVVSRLLVLAAAATAALYAAPPLVSGRHWAGLAVLVAATALIGYVYLGRRHVPAKYLVPGTLLMLVFQLLPVLYTVQVAFTDFGDGHRAGKQDAIHAIETGSLARVPGSAEYDLSIGLSGGKVAFLLTDPATRTVQAGTSAGLRPLPDARVGITGKVLSAPGYRVLTIGEAAAYDGQISALTVPTTGGGIKANGYSHAYEARASKRYDKGCDCVVDGATGTRYRASSKLGAFVDAQGDRLAEGWQVYVGLDNFTRVFTDSTITGHFAGTFVWDLVFSAATVLGTFAIGVGLAVLLHGWRSRSVKVYRLLVILPYAMPAFAMLMVWRSMFNTDFGLVNNVLGLDVDWLGQPLTARLAVILINIWLGFPYMFLVSTGALQAIPDELGEAARIDGAGAWQRFRKITLPLLLVALTPLLISSFAFNFNNFNVIWLVTSGGPFSADNSSVGATDLLISYTYRLAFGGGGAQFGFAAAISTFIFALVAAMSVAMFRRGRDQEEVFA